MSDRGIAIIGVACRLEGVANAERFAAKLGAENWPGASRVLDHTYDFDFGCFGISQAEARWMDPQHRVFLECCREATQRAGYDITRHSTGSVGVFAGAGANRQAILAAARATATAPEGLAATLGNEKDYLTARVAYHLNLRGPSITVQSACSSSLTAIHVACQALLAGECDMAIAGGVSLLLPGDEDEGCGSGAGVVVLRPLKDAIESGDVIHGAILSTAVNNDGGQRASFAMPGSEGQAELIAEAVAVAGLTCGDIDYIECHAAGTNFGDAAESAALRSVFGATAPPLARLQSRIGRLDAASGVLSVIRALWFLEFGYVPGEAISCASYKLRRAAVHSFGIGGANAHAVLEQVPAVAVSMDDASEQVLILSAGTSESLMQLCAETADWLSARPSYNLADVAYTLQVGRPQMAARRAIRCRTVAEAVAQLRMPAPDPAVEIAEFATASMVGRKRVELPPVPFDRQRCALDLNAPLSEPALAPGKLNLESVLRRLWSRTLGRSHDPGLDANFFEAGGTSILATHFIESVNRALACTLPVRALYQRPTFSGFLDLLHRGNRPVEALAPPSYRGDIAIVGAACRFPGANGLDEYWDVLREGRETIRFLGEIRDAADGARFVPAVSRLDDIELFDAEYFGISPAEAQLMDPQIRLILECSATALSNAGYVPGPSIRTALFAGGSPSGYLLNIIENPLGASTPPLQVSILNDRDALTTTVSHRLNLQGPSIDVQTFCSTSLVAVHLAKHSLLAGECDMALAGGVSLNLMLRDGYYYQPGGIYSSDGHCRPFDADANGTIFGEGAGVVVLKRLQDALDAGDPLLAVIKGSAVNNDGNAKAGYTAPGVDGQTRVILDALGNAGVEARSISYVEAHGTATALGDPIEVQALTQAFRASSTGERFCAIGSVKSNIGHLDRAAGMSSLLKAVLALQHKQIPPTLHYRAPNPEIEFTGSPFFVASELQAWPEGDGPHRAGVTALGIGGTNVHVVLEEAPKRETFASSARFHVLPLAANSEAALDTMSSDLALSLERDDVALIADTAYTLQVGRGRRAVRRSLVCADAFEARRLLREPLSLQPTLSYSAAVLLFPGQGMQHWGMGRDLYHHSAVFREWFERCLDCLEVGLSDEIRRIVTSEPNGLRFDRTDVVQPALFAVEYATAQLLMRFGIQPEAVIGHSVGEFVAAAVAEVMSFEDSARLVAARGRLMQQVARGQMMALQCEEERVTPWLGDGVCIAAVNGRTSVVVSGPEAAMDRVREQCAQHEITASLLHTSHAFHSSMMDPVLPEFRRLVWRVGLRTPRVKLYSNVTGRLITAEQAQSVEYWTEHLRAPVRFADCLADAASDGRAVFLDVGPGNGMAALARAHSSFVYGLAPGSQQSELAGDRQFLETLGKLWCVGLPVDWKPLDDGKRGRVRLPPYPFERKRHWLERRRSGRLSVGSGIDTGEPRAFVPVWKRAPAPLVEGRPDHDWMLFLRSGDEALATALAKHGSRVIRVYAGDRFAVLDVNCYSVRIDRAEALRELFATRSGPVRIAYTLAADVSSDEEAMRLGFDVPQAILQALGDNGGHAAELHLICRNVHSVTGEESLNPFPATMTGISQVAAKEFENLTARSVDWGTGDVDSLACELSNPCESAIVALRGRYRWTPAFEEVATSTSTPSRVRKRGVYWITGGTGGIGLSIARRLAQHYHARLVLTQRTPVSEVSSKALGTIRELMEAGAEVLVMAADVTDVVSMRAVVAAARERFGVIHGVVHAAGIAGGGMLALKTPEQARAVMAPKVTGMVALRKALGTEPLDFLAFCSSIASVTGDFGQADYCAANSFLDAYAHWLRQAGVFAQSVNWGPWRDVGMAVNTKVPAEWRQAKESLWGLGIDPANGAEAFDRCLRSDERQMVVTRADLRVFLDSAERVNIRTLKESSVQRQESASSTARRRPEPVYENETQRTLAGIFGKALSLESIGADDNFFQLGGNSLLAVQMLTDLQRAFDGKVSSTHLFQFQTVRDLAAYIEREPDDTGSDDAKQRGIRMREQRRAVRERMS